VTLHNQRDFLFFRRHRLVLIPVPVPVSFSPSLILPSPLKALYREMQANTRYVFDSPTKARLQEIGPRFTLKLRWLKKGLPSVTAPDGRIAHGGNDDLDKVDLEAEKKEEDDAMGDIGSGSTPVQQGPIIPPLDQEQEYEWKWRVSHFISSMNRSRADWYSQRWRSRGELSFCRFNCISLHVYLIAHHYISSVLSLQ
jgi:ribosome production factor 1